MHHDPEVLCIMAHRDMTKRLGKVLHEKQRMEFINLLKVKQSAPYQSKYKIERVDNEFPILPTPIQFRDPLPLFEIFTTELLIFLQQVINQIKRCDPKIVRTSTFNADVLMDYDKKIHRILAHNDMTQILQKSQQEHQRIEYVNLKSFAKPESYNTTLKSSELYEFTTQSSYSLLGVDSNDDLISRCSETVNTSNVAEIDDTAKNTLVCT